MTTVPPAATCCSKFQRFLGILLYAAGIGLSTFAYYVEYQSEHNPGMNNTAGSDNFPEYFTGQTPYLYHDHYFIFLVYRL